MKNEAQLLAEIADLEAILNSAATSISVDGQTTSFDLSQARTRLNELRDELATLRGERRRRPWFATIRLN